MRVSLVLLTVAVGAFAGAAPVVVAVGGSVDGFLVGLAIWAFIPFAILAAISRLMSVPGVLVTLLVVAVIDGLVVSEFLSSSDGQAGLIFLFLPGWMIIGVLGAWGLDALALLIARRTRRHRSA
jgi:hypothetical protein